MRKISAKKYAVSLYEATQAAKEKELPGLLKSFIELLIRRKDMKKADKIIAAYRHYANEQDKLVEVIVTSTESFDKNIRKEIIWTLQSTLGRKVELHEEVDESLIGGIVLRYDDVIVDGSLKKRIASLAESLKL